MGVSCQRSGLAHFFSFLSTTMIECPAFLLHVLASGGPEGATAGDSDGNDDTNDDSTADGVIVLRKALVSAVSSIIDVEADISISAIAFLGSVKSVASKSNTESGKDNTATRSLAGEFNLQFQTSMLSTLLRGICGLFQSFVIPDACRLLYYTLIESSMSEEEFKMITSQGLSQEHFFLGSRARSVVFECCLLLLRKSNTALPLENFESMMADIWHLHRLENIDTIEESDAVYAFCTQHG